MQHTGGTYTGISAGAGMLRIKRSRYGEVLHMKEVRSHTKAETAYFVQKTHIGSTGQILWDAEDRTNSSLKNVRIFLWDLRD